MLFISLEDLCIFFVLAGLLFLSGSPPWVYLKMGRLHGEPRAAAQNSGFGACVLGWGSPVKNRSYVAAEQDNGPYFRVYIPGTGSENMSERVIGDNLRRSELLTCEQ